MHHNIIASDSTEALPKMLALLDRGKEVGSRNGKVVEQMHVGVTLTNPTPTKELRVPGRKPNLAAQIAETMWVLAGRNDIEFLSHYLPRAADFSDDGVTWRGGYGPRIRNWRGYSGNNDVSPGVDQWKYVIDTLQADPTSRRAIINLWDPAIDTTPGKDLPCNDWLSFSIRGNSLDLHVAVRSNDVMWGWSGINHFEWATLLEITAGLLGVDPGALHFSITSLHMYEPHFLKASAIMNASGTSPTVLPSPAFWLPVGNRDLRSVDALFEEWFEIEAKIRHGGGRYGGAGWEARIDQFPEPMLQSWLRVLQWWWTGDGAYLRPLLGTSIYAGCLASLQPARPAPAMPVGFPPAEQRETFSDYVCNLHDEKHAMYGDSWKRRGEMLGIMANIARKVDRLGKTGGGDTSTDTAIDLLVYLCKYHAWLLGLDTDTTREANHLIRYLEEADNPNSVNAHLDTADLEKLLTSRFEHLEFLVTNGRDTEKIEQVNKMLIESFYLARRLWSSDRMMGVLTEAMMQPVVEVHDEKYRGADAD